MKSCGREAGSRIERVGWVTWEEGLSVEIFEQRPEGYEKTNQAQIKG